jgi:hypothetical protein
MRSYYPEMAKKKQKKDSAAKNADQIQKLSE